MLSAAYLPYHYAYLGVKDWALMGCTYFRFDVQTGVRAHYERHYAALQPCIKMVYSRLHREFPPLILLPFKYVKDWLSTR